jgi:uncharacterized membrane protein YedE/YeeE
MEAFFWILIGFVIAQLVGLFTTTTPETAAENLRKWRYALWHRRS